MSPLLPNKRCYNYTPQKPLEKKKNFNFCQTLFRPKNKKRRPFLFAPTSARGDLFPGQIRQRKGPAEKCPLIKYLSSTKKKKKKKKH